MINDNIFPADTIRVSDITDRVDELVEDDDPLGEDDTAELVELTTVLSELVGNGGDHRWEGDWYPGTLIRDDHFEDYARELAEDLYADGIADGNWPFTHIDWEAAARELQTDYTTVDVDGVTYWYR